MAIQCLAVVGGEVTSEELGVLLSHSDSKTQILGAWLALVKEKNTVRAQELIQKYLSSSDRMLRLITSAAIAQTGAKGQALAKKVLLSHDDPLVRLNLAIYLIWQRTDLTLASSTLLATLKDNSRLSWHSLGIFNYIGPTASQHVGGYVRLPESQDLLLRLELYGILATCPQQDLKQALKAFLQDRTWGISSQTAFLMMQEELLCFDELRDLLDDPTPEIALQAAFILAIFAQDDEALKVLEEAFPTATRQMKDYILYAIGTIGAKSSLPFLVDVLTEPFESLRISAARAILLSLYH